MPNRRIAVAEASPRRQRTSRRSGRTVSANHVEPVATEEPLSSASYSGASRLPSLTQRYAPEAELEAEAEEESEVEAETAEALKPKQQPSQSSEPPAVEAHNAEPPQPEPAATEAAQPEVVQTEEAPLQMVPEENEPSVSEPSEARGRLVAVPGAVEYQRYSMAARGCSRHPDAAAATARGAGRGVCLAARPEQRISSSAAS